MEKNEDGGGRSPVGVLMRRCCWRVITCPRDHHSNAETLLAVRRKNELTSARRFKPKRPTTVREKNYKTNDDSQN